MYLLTSPKNATYLSPTYVANRISIMNEYIKAPLLKSLINGQLYTLYNDETQDISTTEQLAINSTFEYNNKISEHYCGIIPISQLVGNHLSAKNVLKAIPKYLLDLRIELVNGRFFCMDTTNMNSGEKGVIKHLLQHAVPLALWTGCGNHKVALCFKHLLQVSPNVFAADATLLALWKFFHYRSLAITFVKHEEKQV